MDELYFKKIQITRDFGKLKKGYVFSLNKVTLLVGPNGSGKSTIIKDILGKRVNGESIPCDFSHHDFCESLTENLSNEKNSAKYMAGIESMYLSRGEANADFIKGLAQLKSRIVILDEPEQGLDIDNMKMLVKNIQDNKSCQFLIATHSLKLMNLFEDGIVELEKGYYTKLKTFMK